MTLAFCSSGKQPVDEHVAMIDAVVLGGGRLPTGQLTQLSKERLATAADVIKRHEVSSITVMGGRHSSWQSNALTFDVPFADLKREYLRDCGVDGGSIRTIEEDTRDTISEAFVFWRHNSATSSVAVITSTPHLARARYLFQRVGGHGKQVEVIGVPDSEDVLNPTEEAEYLSATERVLQVEPMPSYESWEQWRSSHADLYEEFARIRTRYAATELHINEAYGAVRRSDPAG